MTNTAIRLIAVFTLVTVFIAHADDRERRGQRGQSDQRRGGDGDGRRDVNWDAIKSRVEAGVKSGRITREQANRIYEGLRRRMGGEAAKRDSDNDRDRMEEARKGYEIRRKRIEEGVRSGKIKREDAARMLRDLRARMEAASRGRDRDDDNRDRKRTGDIVDVAAGNKSFGTLVAAVKAAGLVDTLKGKGPYTVFAPTDEAFSKLPKGTVESLLKPENRKKLVSILTYHVVPGKVLAKDVKSGRVKTANGSSLDVRVSRGGVTVNKAKVVATDVMASNGVIHVIDSVIIPASRESQARSSQSRGSSRGYLGVSVESTSRPRGVRVQQVFANTGAARAKLKKGDVIQKLNGASVTSNSGLIRELARTKPGQKITLLVSSAGKTRTVQVQLGGSYNSRSAQSSRQNSSSRDSRKRTGDIVDVAAGNKSFGTLVAAVKAAGLVDTLKGKGPYTVFAPTDEAFSKLPKGTVESLLKPENRKKLVSILTYHVVPGKVLAKDVKSGRVKTANGSSLDVRVSRGGVTVNKAKVVATDVMASNGVIHVIDSVIIPASRESQASDRRKAWEERIKKAREDRERAERNSRGRGNDRGEQMRKEWEERMKRWREMQNRGSRWGGPRRR